MPKLAYNLRNFRDNHLNIKWPRRPRTNDGWIGDASHEATGSPEQGGSSHNPNSRDTVDAIDIDSTQPRATGTPIHVPTVIASLLMHPSTWYVIHKRRIMSRKNGFMPVRYTGKSPHDAHIHANDLQTATAENSKAAYKFILAPMSWGLLKPGKKGNQVKELQAYLIGHGYGVRIDGDFGPKTLAAVKGFQAASKIKVDGEVGPVTRNKLRPFA